MMAINLNCMDYLQQKKYLTKSKNRLLDIGPQNIYFATEDQIRNFVANQGQCVSDSTLETETARIVYFSTPRPEERTSLLSEVTDLTNIEYHSFDVCPALKTEILDLNYDDLPERHGEYFDVILNFGTTEHVFNQWNSFKIMHDALKVGGVIYHQLPGTGYLDHGYFCYTPVFFDDLAKANDYEVLDIFFTDAGITNSHLLADIRPEAKLLSVGEARPLSGLARCFNINVILQKKNNHPFRCALELATSHSSINSEIEDRYNQPQNATYFGPGGVVRLISEIENLTTENMKLALSNAKLAAVRDELLSSSSWRVTKPLRAIADFYRRGKRMLRS